jgi:hypothetical protein
VLVVFFLKKNKLKRDYKCHRQLYACVGYVYETWLRQTSFHHHLFINRSLRHIHHTHRGTSTPKGPEEQPPSAAVGRNTATPHICQARVAVLCFLHLNTSKSTRRTYCINSTTINHRAVGGILARAMGALHLHSSVQPLLFSASPAAGNSRRGGSRRGSSVIRYSPAASGPLLLPRSDFDLQVNFLISYSI